MDLLLDIVGIVTIFFFLIFTVALLRSNKRKTKSNSLFSVFLISNILLILFSIFYRNTLIIPSESALLYFTIASLFFILAPLLYFYFTTSFKKSTLSNYYLLHLIPAAIIFASLTIHYYFRLSSSSGSETVHMWTSNSYNIYLVLLNVQTVIYIFLIIKSANKYFTSHKNNYSEPPRISELWFKLVMAVFITHWFFDILASYSVFWNYSLTGIFEFISLSILLLFASIIVYKGLKGDSFLEENENIQKYKNSNLTPEKTSEFALKLEEFMNMSKPYLSPTLTLNELAEMLNIHPKNLSQIINENFNQNFFEFVNSYRVKEAKEILVTKNSEYSKKTILEILYEVGFNSKSAFNRAFKKQIGITPSQFRKLERT